MKSVGGDRIRRKVAFLVSGGIDSAVLLAAFVKSGGQCIAYTVVSPREAGSELTYAQAVCAALGVELFPILADDFDDFSPEWRFALPYNHPWYERLHRLALQ